MGVLNNTSDGFANVLYILSNYIIKNGPTEINELLTIFNMGINDNNNSINNLFIFLKEFRTIIKITYNSILIKDTLTIHRQKGSRFIVKNIWEGSNKH